MRSNSLANEYIEFGMESSSAADKMLIKYIENTRALCIIEWKYQQCRALALFILHKRNSIYCTESLVTFQGGASEPAV